MIILFDNTVTKEQADNPQWVWLNWDKGIPCISWAEAFIRNTSYYGGQGAIGILISYESAKQRGYV